MEPHEVLRTRLAGQQLREPRAAAAEEALKNLLAVQSQELPCAVRLVQPGADSARNRLRRQGLAPRT